jgi:hypothetical protein
MWRCLVPSKVLQVVPRPHEDHGVGFARAGVDVPNTVERECADSPAPGTGCGSRTDANGAAAEFVARCGKRARPDR